MHEFSSRVRAIITKKKRDIQGTKNIIKCLKYCIKKSVLKKI